MRPPVHPHHNGLALWSSVTVRCASDTVLWVVPKEAYLDMAARRPDSILAMGLSLSSALSERATEAEAALQVLVLLLVLGAGPRCAEETCQPGCCRVHALERIQ